MTRITGHTFFRHYQSQFKAQRTNMAELQRQVATQKEIKDDTELPALGMVEYRNINSILVKNETYENNVDTIDRRLKMFSDVFENFKDIIDDMQNSISNIDNVIEAEPLELERRAEEYMRMVEDILNIKDVGDFYLFNGQDGRRETMPIEIIGNMTTAYTVGTLPTVISDPLYPPDAAGNIPPYSHFNDYTTHLEDEYNTYRPYSMNIGEGQSFEMDITPYEPFIQNLVYGLDVIRKAVAADPALPIQTSLTRAEELLAASESQFDEELRHLESNRIFIDGKKEQVAAENKIYRDFLEGKDTVQDLAEVIAEMQQLQTMSDRSYSLTRRTAQLSFVNFF